MARFVLQAELIYRGWVTVDAPTEEQAREKIQKMRPVLTAGLNAACDVIGFPAAPTVNILTREKADVVLYQSGGRPIRSNRPGGFFSRAFRLGRLFLREMYARGEAPVPPASITPPVPPRKDDGQRFTLPHGGS